MNFYLVVKSYLLLPLIALFSGCGGTKGTSMSQLMNEYEAASREIWTTELEDNKDHNRDGFIGAPR